MKTHALILASVVALLMAMSAHAEPATKKLCIGEWTDMRKVGLSIGECDLNRISDKELKWIKRSACGEP
jgi:hypothetical protein